VKGILLLLSTFIFCPLSSLAQTSIGNGSVIAPAPGELQPYGVNGMTTNTEGAFPTRHFRMTNSPGIGGSFLETTSPTSESSPAVLIPPANSGPVKTPYRSPSLERAYTSEAINPALKSISPALPAFPKSSALTNPLTNPPSLSAESSRLGTESLPSFQRQRSILDRMEFDQFNRFDVSPSRSSLGI
jgi:hypothetical protein